MRVIIKLVILSTHPVTSACCIHHVTNSIPERELQHGEDVKVCAMHLLDEVCGVKCAESEVIPHGYIETVDDAVYITYGVLIPYNVNNEDEKYKTTPIQNFIDAGGLDEQDINRISTIAWKV